MNSGGVENWPFRELVGSSSVVTMNFDVSR